LSKKKKQNLFVQLIMSQTSTLPPSANVTVVVAKPAAAAVPPPLNLAPTKTTNEAISDQGASTATGQDHQNGQDTTAATSTTKKRKRSSSNADERKVKKSKVDEKEKKKKNKKKREEEEEVSVHQIEDSDDEEEEDLGVAMSKAEFEEFVQSIMEITRCQDPKVAMVMLEHKLNIIDNLKTWFGLELHDDDTKLLQLLTDTQLSGIYKGLVVGKLILSMEEFQKDGPMGFVNHLLESEASGKHLLPYSFCCWKSDSENIQSTLEENKRQAAMSPNSKNFWMLNKDDEMKKALRRTKFWYAFGREMDKAIQSGQIDESTLTWEDLKAYCEVFWYENEEGKKFRKFYVAVHGQKSSNSSSGQNTQFQSFPAWPVPKGAYKEEKDFLLGVWPFVQIYFMSPKEGPVVLVNGRKEKAKAEENKKPSFDFKAALEKRNRGKPVQHESTMVVDNDDDKDSDSESDSERQEAKKSKKHKKSNKSKGGRLSKFVDSQAQEDDY
jgi:hypothetical protein